MFWCPWDGSYNFCFFKSSRGGGLGIKISKRGVAEMAMVELIFFYVIIIKIIMMPTNLSLGLYSYLEYLSS